MLEASEIYEWLDAHINLERNQLQTSTSDSWNAEERLASARRLYSVLDEPQHKFGSIHITGTNGKSSTSRVASQLLVSMGVRTGTYTSPHVQHLTERIALDGQPVGEPEFLEALNSIRLIEQMIEPDKQPTYFDILTAAAFLIFADAPVHAGVIEVGLGGRFDSTNAIDAAVSVITNIGEDHKNFLGPTRAHIAEQKAGIVREGATLVTAEEDPEMLAIFEKQNPAQLLVAGRDFEVISNRLAVGGRLLDVRTPKSHYEDVFVALHGAHQGINAATALVAVESWLGKEVPADAVVEAFENVVVPGRMEIAGRSPLCVLDGAHNSDAASKLTAAIDEEFSSSRDRVLVVGMLGPHEPAEFLKSLQAERARLVIACRAPSERAIDPSEIAARAAEMGAPTVVVQDVGDAIEEALAAAGEESVVLVTGSLYVVGEARSHLSD